MITSPKALYGRLTARCNAATARNFARAIWRNRRGNTLAIIAAALIPVIAAVGAGVDTSRGYMCKARLQQAVDSAALAGRRAQSGNTLTDAAINEAKRFFAFNFPQGSYQTADVNPMVTMPEVGTVQVTASTTVPTAIMRFFGMYTMNCAATAQSKQNFVNTDVMLVLDVTGSMADDVNGNNASPPNRKIDNLRTAVLALYDELKPAQDELEGRGLRLRYGVVPYSTNANVGAAVMAANASYIADNGDYQSREPVWAYATGTTAPTPLSMQTYGSSISSSNCVKYGNNQSFSGFSGGPNPQSSGTPPNDVTMTTYSYGDWGATGDTSGTSRTCRRNRSYTVTSYTTVDNGAPPVFTGNWTYKQMNFDTSAFKTGASTPVPSRIPGTTQNAIWNGCIDERQTVDTITSSSGFTVPAGALDLNINLVPNSDASRWKPFWPEVVYRRAAGSVSATTGSLVSNHPCPAPARSLQAWARTDLSTYLNTLSPTGNTYHDIGMIWGARMLSPGGIFAGSNPTTYGGYSVQKHIIFMTDGQLMPSTSVYSAYGYEPNDERITGGNLSDQTPRHRQRFLMACNEAKKLGMNVWVVAFASGITAGDPDDDAMKSCASSPDQAMTANNLAELTARFTEIGQAIGQLRIVQ